MHTTNLDRPRRKLTLRLPAHLYEASQEAVRSGLASTLSAFIEEAIRRRAREVRHARLRRLAAEAMADPEFVADMHRVTAEFRHVDGEHWPLTDEETQTG